ncbi:MAG: HpcH/HpaI aldolase family protein [Caulobacteraceae bacterium]
MSREFADQVRARHALLGTFLKTAASEPAEILGRAGFDFAIIDAEHAPFDLPAIDHVVLGGLSAELPCLVRTPDLDAGFIGQCLDLGAAGILAPHVTSAQTAQRIVAAARFAAGEFGVRRGFSPSTRAGGYGLARGYPAGADEAVSVWCQIEDAEALGALDAIASQEGVDCLFVGRADLAVSLGLESAGHERVGEALAAVAQAARRCGKAAGVHLSEPAEFPSLVALGVTVFACGSDLSFLIGGARSAQTAFAAAVGPASPRVDE